MYNNSGRPDALLFCGALLCCSAGMLLAASMQYIGAGQEFTSGSVTGLLWTHIAAVLAGGVLCALLTLIGSDTLARHGGAVLAGGLLLTLLTFTPLGYSPEGSDDRAWISLGFTTVQPSEILKLCFIISFAAHIMQAGERINEPRDLALLLLHAAVPTGIVWAQGDQGTCVIFIVIAAAMLVVGGLSVRIITAALLLSPLAAWGAWGLLGEHQKQRLAVLLDPSLDPLGTGFQQLSAGKALASGGWFGSGLFSRERELVYVSQSQNDFIFSYAAQTGGFLLCAVIVLLLFGTVMRAAVLSGRSRGAGRLMSAGAAAMLFAHTFINIAMVLGFMPVIGVPLPFISAGGTAVVSMLGGIGLVQAGTGPKANEIRGG